MTKIAPRALADLVRRPLISEKATMLLGENKYTFEVDPRATKPQIKAAIESLFSVHVVSVNTQHPPRQKRRVGRFTGHRPQYKRALVTLAPGESITLFPEV